VAVHPHARRVRARGPAGRALRRRLSQLVKNDPTLRSFTTTSGKLCLQAGEESNGRVGRFGNGAFYEQPLAEGGTCGDGGPFLAVNRDLDRRSTSEREPERTAAFGVLPADARDATVVLPDARRPIQPDARGAFLVIVPEVITGRYPRVEWGDGEGRRHSLGGDVDAGRTGAPR